MKRRNFMTCAFGAGAAWAAPSLAVQPTQGCYAIHSAKQRCVSGFAETPEIPVQECRSLCWATCLAYMLRGFGAHVSTETVFDRYGLSSACEAPDDRAQLLRAAGAWKDDAGRSFLLQTTELQSLHDLYPARPIWEQTINRIARQPILCGAAGHTTLITEITAQAGTMVGIKRESITVRDPWVRSQPLRLLSNEELEHPFYVIALSIRAI